MEWRLHLSQKTWPQRRQWWRRFTRLNATSHSWHSRQRRSGIQNRVPSSVRGSPPPGPWRPPVAPEPAPPSSGARGGSCASCETRQSRVPVWSFATPSTSCTLSTAEPNSGNFVSFERDVSSMWERLDVPSILSRTKQAAQAAGRVRVPRK